MRLPTRLFLCTLLITWILVPSSYAQIPQTPDTDMIAAGGDFGVLFPDEAFETTVTLDGFAEYYVTPRISVRGMLAWASPGFDNRTEDKFRQVKLLFNGAYNWEFVEWHPFVTAGAGAYFVRQLFDLAPDPDGETRGGLNFGAGVEYFTGELSSIKAEGRFDLVSHPPGLPDATGFTLSVGYKLYF